MKKKLPEGWEEIELSEILEFKNKTGIKAGEGKEKGEYKFYTSSDVQNKYVDNYTFDEEILIFSTGGTAGIHYSNEKCSTSNDCFVIKIGSRVISKYVYYYLKANINLLEAGFRGSGLKHLSKEYLKGIKIIFPTKIEKQNRIVIIVERIENIKLLREQASCYNNILLQTLFIEMFGNPLINNKKWKLQHLKDIARIERGKFSPRPRNDPRYYGGKYPFIQTGDISSSGGMITKWVQTLNEKGIEVSHCFKKGTIVLAIVGATIGVSAILDIDVYAPDSVVGITINPSKVTKEYVEFVLRFWKKVFLSRAPETARANINLEIIKPISIPIPPLELQKAFSNRCHKIMQIQKSLEMSKIQIDNLFKIVLNSAIKGDLDI